MSPLTGVLGESWRLYRAHAAHLIGLALCFYLPVAILEAVLGGLLGAAGALLAGVISIVAAFLLQAALVKAVDDVRDGRADLSIGDTVRTAQPFIVPVAGASILAGIGIAIGLVLLVIPGLILATLWAVIVPVIVLERAGIGAAFSRSSGLVRRFLWPALGTLLLVGLLLIGVQVVIGLLLTVLPRGISSFVSTIVSGSLVGPFLSVVVTLAYFRLRAAQGSDAVGMAEPPYPRY